MNQKENCASCHKHFDSDDPGNAWNDDWFCRDCIHAALSTEFGELATNPRESLNSGYTEALWRGIRSALITDTIMSALVFMIFLFIQLSIQLQQVGAGKPLHAVEPMTWILFLIGTWVFVGAVLVSTINSYSLTSRHRSIYIENEHLTQTIECRTIRIPLAECVWYHSEFGLEPARSIYWGRPLICIYNQQDPTDSVVCGFTDESHRLWTGYLVLTRRQYLSAISKMQLCVSCSIGLLLGGAIGFGLGACINVVTRDTRWIAVWSLIGVLDGLVFGLIDAYATSLKQSKIDTPFGISRAAAAAMIVGTAAMLGLKIGVSVGVVGGIACGVANGVIGILFSLWVGAKRLRPKPPNKAP